MADAKISGLPDGGQIQPADQVPVNRAGTTMRATGAAFLSGAGSPAGVVAGTNGDLYRDTDNGALYLYVGNTDTDWVIVAGNNDTSGNYPTGVTHGGNNQRLVAAAGRKAIVSDSAAQDGTGNGLYWNDFAAADGSQILSVYTGSSAQFATRVDANGHLRPSTLVLTNHAAPADADLSAGDCALWFDQTNGAAKLMIKGKSANGTVVTGSVNLA